MFVEPMGKTHAVGIDLGTTFSAVAYVSETGQTTMLRSGDGELLTPSVVLFDEDRVVVGQAAKEQAGFQPGGVAECVKRDMGSAAFSRLIHGEKMPPEVIQACILRHLKKNVTAVLGDDFQVVITVPAYFDERRRKATADAGFMAGFEVMDIINEPTAAALAFGEHLGYLTVAGAPRDHISVLVYDLGGGTFDVTVIRLKPGDVRTVATDGDVRLGGRDWDQRLVDYAAEAFLAEHGLDPRQDAGSLAKLFHAAEQAKHQLSIRARTKILVEHGGRTLAVPLERGQMIEMTADLLERTAYTTRQVLAAARLDWDAVDRVLMVGGSTRMPMVAKMLEELSGITPDHSVNPDEAVARGAAIYAGYRLSVKDRGKTAPRFKVVDVNSHSLGIEGIDQETGRKENVILIPRNTPLPARVNNRFVTKMKGQRSVVVKVLEGESADPDGCITIGKAVLRRLPADLPKGHPIEVAYRYAADGRLEVRADVPGTDRKVAIELEREGALSDEQASRWRQVVTAESRFSDFEQALQEALDLGLESEPTTAVAPDTRPTPVEPTAKAALAPADGPATSARPATSAQPVASAAPKPVDRPAAGPVETATTTESPSPESRVLGPISRRARQNRQRAWLTVSGHVVASLLGLLIGWLILAYFKILPFPALW